MSAQKFLQLVESVTEVADSVTTAGVTSFEVAPSDVDALVEKLAEDLGTALVDTDGTVLFEDKARNVITIDRASGTVVFNEAVGDASNASASGGFDPSKKSTEDAGARAKQKSGNRWDQKSASQVKPGEQLKGDGKQTGTGGTKGVGDKGMPAKYVREQMDAIFASLTDGRTIDEDFVNDLKDIVQGAVDSLAEARAEAIISAELAKRLNTLNEELTDRNDKFMAEAIEVWMEDNRVAIESGYVVDRARKLTESLSDVLATHGIDIELADSDAVERADALQEQADALAQDNAALLEELTRYRKDVLVSEASAGMTDIAKDRFVVLAENVSFRDPDQFKRVLETIKSTVSAPKVAARTTEVLTEEVQTAPRKTAADSLFGDY
jgi:predicted DNA-binding protein